LSFQIHNKLFSTFVDVNTEPQIIADGCIWAEGPVWLKDRLYFNDIPNKRMLSWHPVNGVDVVLSNNEFGNGNTTGLDGRMVSCEHGGRRVIVRNNPTDINDVTIIADQFDGQPLNSPNDVVVKSDGSIWFTDPTYGIDSNIEGYAAKSAIGSNNVYRVDPNGTVDCVVDDFVKPNGLAFSPDEKRLYIADSGAIRGAAFPDFDHSLPHHLRVFDVDDKRLLNSRVIVEIDAGVPDGLRIDTEGFLWCSAADGIHCLSAEGELIGKITLPAATANCCFGGQSGTDLFITASDRVYRVRTTRRGAESLRKTNTAQTLPENVSS